MLEAPSEYWCAGAVPASCFFRRVAMLSDHRSSVSIHVTAKPVGALCSLSCTYCYYAQADKLRSIQSMTIHMENVRLLMEEKRANPGNDLLTDMVQAEDEGTRFSSDAA